MEAGLSSKKVSLLDIHFQQGTAANKSVLWDFLEGHKDLNGWAQASKSGSLIAPRWTCMSKSADIKSALKCIEKRLVAILIGLV